jgi:hypothetical protein
LRSTVPLTSSASTRLVPAVVPNPAIGVPAP